MDDYLKELLQEIELKSSDIDPMTIEIIKLSERVKIFNNLRNLIHEKEFENDDLAANVLGWAYERLAD